MELRPNRGGFLRPFGCAWFIREFLLGNGPEGSAKIDPHTGAPQADIFYHYKTALLAATALDRATRQEEKQAKQQNRPIDPENIERLVEKYQSRLPYTKKVVSNWTSLSLLQRETHCELVRLLTYCLVSLQAAAFTLSSSTSPICKGWAG